MHIIKENLVREVVDLLKEKQLTIASAESCTGGLFADSIISLPGTSQVFDRAIVTYSNRAKMEEVGVLEETLEKFGAVSSQTAVEMASGLAKVSKCDICVSVTGIAGPDGGSPEKPVGLVYMCVHYKDRDIWEKHIFENMERNAVRQNSVIKMLQLVLKVLGDE